MGLDRRDRPRGRPARDRVGGPAQGAAGVLSQALRLRGQPRQHPARRGARRSRPCAWGCARTPPTSPCRRRDSPRPGPLRGARPRHRRGVPARPAHQAAAQGGGRADAHARVLAQRRRRQRHGPVLDPSRARRRCRRHRAGPPDRARGAPPDRRPPRARPPDRSLLLGREDRFGRAGARRLLQAADHAARPGSLVDRQQALHPRPHAAAPGGRRGGPGQRAVRHPGARATPGRGPAGGRPGTQPPQWTIWRTDVPKPVAVAHIGAAQGAAPRPTGTGRVNGHPAPAGHLSGAGADARPGRQRGPQPLARSRRATRRRRRGGPGSPFATWAPRCRPSRWPRARWARSSSTRAASATAGACAGSGGTRTVAAGTAIGPAAPARAPGGAPGVYLLTLTSAGHVYRTPVAVAASKVTEPVLVVPPGDLVAGPQPGRRHRQGRARHADYDGERPPGAPVRGRRAAARFSTQEGALLAWLQRHGTGYDVTTDAALRRRAWARGCSTTTAWSWPVSRSGCRRRSGLSLRRFVSRGGTVLRSAPTRCGVACSCPGRRARPRDPAAGLGPVRLAHQADPAPAGRAPHLPGQASACSRPRPGRSPATTPSSRRHRPAGGKVVAAAGEQAGQPVVARLPDGQGAGDPHRPAAVEPAPGVRPGDRGRDEADVDAALAVAMIIDAAAGGRRRARAPAAHARAGHGRGAGAHAHAPARRRSGTRRSCTRCATTRSTPRWARRSRWSRVGLVAWLFARRPRLFPVLAVIALPFRLPIETGGQTANLLVPLYFVIAAGALAWLVPRLRGGRAWTRDERPRGRAGVGAARRSSSSTRVQATYSLDFDKALEPDRVLLHPVRAAVHAAVARGLDRRLLMQCFGVARRPGAGVRGDRLRGVRHARRCSQPEGDPHERVRVLLPRELALLRPEHLRPLPGAS